MYSPAVRHLQVYGDTFVSALMTALRIEESTGDIYTSTKIFANEINATSIGATTPGTGNFTTLGTSGKITVTNANIRLSNAYFLSGNLASGTEVTLIGRNVSNNVSIDPDGYGTVMGGNLSVTGTLTTTSNIIVGNNLGFNGGVNEAIAYSASALRFYVGGPERANITSAGLSVTGTGTFGARLSVNNANPIIGLDATSDLDTTGYAYINFRDNSTGSYVERAYVGYGAGNGNFNIYSGAPGKTMTLGVDGVTNVLTISSSGLSVTGTGTFSGALILSDGTVGTATGAIYFSNDTNTGFYRAGADTLGFTTGGASVGTWSPSGLSVVGTGTFSDDIINSNGGSNNKGFKLTSGGNHRLALQRYDTINAGAALLSAFGSVGIEAGASSGVGTGTLVGIFSSAGLAVYGTMDQGIANAYQTHTSAGHTISFSVATEQWVKLCTLGNRSYARIRIGTSSNNSEEEAEVTVATTYTTSETYISVTRQTYNHHIKEVRVTGSDGGSKTVFVLIRADTFAPTMVWKLMDAKGFVSIDNTNTTPGSGVSFYTSSYNRLTGSNGVLLVGTNGFPLQETYFGFSSTYRVLRIGQNTSNRSLALNVDPTITTGGSFTGNGQILIGNNSILAPNSGATDWIGVIRATSGNVLVGPSLSSGEVSGPLTVTTSGISVAGTLSVPSSGSPGSADEFVFSRVDSSPFRIARYNSKGGSGTWRGAHAFQVNYNNGTAFDALTINANTDGTTAAISVTGTLSVTGTFTLTNASMVLSTGYEIQWGSNNAKIYGSNNTYVRVAIGGSDILNTTSSGVSVTGSLSATGAISQNGNQVLHAGNYTSYSPSLTGSGASGTWGINITGTVNGNSVGTMASRNVTIQSGGSPSGGSDGDVFFIY